MRAQQELAVPVAERPAGRSAGTVADAVAQARRGAWHQPVVWLALAIFVASMLGCIGMIVLAGRLADPAMPAPTGPTIMKMPIERQPLPSLPEPAPAARRPGASD